MQESQRYPAGRGGSLLAEPLAVHRPQFTGEVAARNSCGPADSAQVDRVSGSADGHSMALDRELGAILAESASDVKNELSVASEPFGGLRLAGG